MNAKAILEFLNALAVNNNREWFGEHKAEYTACKNDFEQFVQEWIDRMTALDPQLHGLQPKDCMWRIYRDTRFSTDKTPYKDHFGAFVAPKGGKKSPYAGYYVHLQPGECMFAAGMWCPEPELLKAIRQSILDNCDELEEIMERPQMRKYFSDFDTYSTLKKLPAGFPSDFPHPQWLKLKTFTVSCGLTDKEITSPALADKVMEMCEAAKPLCDFLDYTFEEAGIAPKLLVFR